jgi:hypothetical protein
LSVVAAKLLLAGLVIALAGCGEAAPAAQPTPSPIDAYVEVPTGTANIFLEVTTTPALQDILKLTGATQLDALPGGSEISCHKYATVDNSPLTIWDDGTPDGKTFAQEECNRK